MDSYGGAPRIFDRARHHGCPLQTLYYTCTIIHAIYAALVMALWRLGGEFDHAALLEWVNYKHTYDNVSELVEQALHTSLLNAALRKYGLQATSANSTLKMGLILGHVLRAMSPMCTKYAWTFG